MKRFVCFLLAWALALALPNCGWFNGTNDCPPLTGNGVYGAGGDGAGGDDGFGGSDVGDGVGGSDVGVGADSAAVGVGAGPGSSDVGAGAGPGSADVGAGAGSARSVPHRPRRARWHWHWHATDAKDGPIGTAVEAICAPNLVPLTTMRLRAIAAQNNIGVGLTGIQQSREIGLAFETWALTTLGLLPPNKTSFSSPRRKAANKNSGGLPASVIPEFVAPLYVATEDDTTPIPFSSFYEVKAVTGALTPSTRQYQIIGLLDVATLSPAGISLVPHHPPPQLTLITTGNTTVSQLLIQQANMLGVGLWQQVVFEDLNTPSNNPMLYLAGAGPLNPGVYLPAVAVQADVTWAPSTLTSPGTLLTVVPGDPDPPEVD